MVLFLALGASLIGCSADKVWANRSKNTQQFYADKAECQAMSNSGGSNSQIMPTFGSPGFGTGFSQGWNTGSAISSAAARNDIFESCMMGRGWLLVEKQAATSPPAKQTTAPTQEQNQTESLGPTPIPPVGAMVSFSKLIQEGGYDWSQKDNEGSIYYFKTSSVVKESGVMSFDEAAYFASPKVGLCNSSKISYTHSLFKVAIKIGTSQFRVISKKDFWGDKIVCEVSSPSGDFTETFKEDSVMAFWLKAKAS